LGGAGEGEDGGHLVITPVKEPAEVPGVFIQPKVFPAGLRLFWPNWQPSHCVPPVTKHDETD